MRFRCRKTVPLIGDWIDIDADSPEQAVNDYHLAYDSNSIVHAEEEENGGRHLVLFARIEVEGHGSWVSRIYSYGLWRKGGVKPGQPSLVNIAERLGYMDDPRTLLDPNWDCEESMEDAKRRQREEFRSIT
jgi:hypothetical protein